MARQSKVHRPTKKVEFEIVFATTQAERGWRDLSGTTRNALVDAWDFLTRTPTMPTPLNYRLRGELSVVRREGKSYDRWQLKPTAKGDARIWYFVVGQTVHLEQVYTQHPNQTK